MRNFPSLIPPKYRRRALTVAKNALHNLLLPIFNILISSFVVRYASVALWGEFVALMIVVQFGAQIINWGNKEYLLRAFSFNPAGITQAWQTALWSRMGLFGLFCLLIWLWAFTPGQLILTILWCLGLVLVQSHDVFVLYRRDFLFAALVEFVSAVIMALVIYLLKAETTLTLLLWLFSTVHLAKTAVYLWRFRRDTLAKVAGRFDMRYFRYAFPFFLLGFSGMLQSRIDLYSVNFYLGDVEVGRYQVFINLMIYLQALANFILLPFVKGIYRLNNKAILKISGRLFVFGLLAMGPLLLAARLMLQWLYHFDLPLIMFLIGGAFVLPIYFYLPVIYALYKMGTETAVLKINILGILINFSLNVLLLPGFGIAGALIASAVAQWGMLLAYLYQSRFIRREGIDGATDALPELP